MKRNRQPNARRRRVYVIAAAAALLVGGLTVPVVSTPAQAATTTAVSLTFDDGNADQMQAKPILDKYAMKGTFYIITGSIGAPNYLTRADLQTLSAGGNEIAGHTVNHPDLTTVPADEAKRQICNGRAALASWGYQATSFAYPYAALNASVESIAQQCGYNSARGLGDLRSAHGCNGCPYAETVPPADPYALKALDEHDNTWTLAQMQSAVTNAERTGGWVPFTFHHVCAGTGCDALSITPTMLDQFLSWLAARTSRGTTVKTVNQVVGGTVKPIVTAPASTNTGLVNTSLETSTSGTGFPDCYMPGGYGNNTATWARTTAAHTGTAAEQLTVTNYQDGDAKLLPTFDLGACTPTGTAGQTYTVSVWYKSTAITQFALYYRTTDGFWTYWTSGPWLAAAPNWTQGTFTTPPLPAGGVGFSFGLSLIANGTLTTDDYGLASGSGTPAVRAAATAAGSPSPLRGAIVSHQWGKNAKPLVPSVRGVVIPAAAPGD
ncbi:polysaccharide deacetylase family protein [Amycolatopsis sp. GM8]|uniref:polysaccharide deacetylase family protein n=1 Tax=Amycolatopsis sp. GM8 TaxID=2896530 RepID=UPI001F26E5AE|nr:polysaccharide deacetylase family protein [Amycolatopsis sp. GM8]